MTLFGDEIEPLIFVQNKDAVLFAPLLSGTIGLRTWLQGFRDAFFNLDCSSARGATVPNFLSHIQSAVNEPILFRTTNDEVAGATVETGSLWLRSDQYYRELEDRVRNDDAEGVNEAGLGVALNLFANNAPPMTIQGTGSIGQKIVPHYILSLHGTSISMAQRRAFGGHTIGIRSVAALAAEVLYRSSRQVRCTGYRYGAVAYQHATLSVMDYQVGGAAMQLADNPPLYLNPINTDVLRKRPVHPFIEQDEWRVAIFVDQYFQDGPSEPLKINVDVGHFYDYERL